MLYTIKMVRDVHEGVEDQTRHHTMQSPPLGPPLHTICIDLGDMLPPARPPRPGVNARQQGSRRAGGLRSEKVARININKQPKRGQNGENGDNKRINRFIFLRRQTGRAFTPGLPPPPPLTSLF